MKKEIKIDKLGRIVIPVEMRKALGLTDKVTFELDIEKGIIMLYAKGFKDIKDCIKARLKKKDITQSERNFLEKLLKINL